MKGGPEKFPGRFRYGIDQEKPAHTAYDIEFEHSTMQIGVRSTIGVDTLLGQLP